MTLKVLPIQTQRRSNLTLSKIGQSQPRIIIYINSVELDYQMLHTKFQDHRTLGSRENILRFLPYMVVADILVM